MDEFDAQMVSAAKKSGATDVVPHQPNTGDERADRLHQRTLRRRVALVAASVIGTVAVGLAALLLQPGEDSELPDAVAGVGSDPAGGPTSLADAEVLPKTAHSDGIAAIFDVEGLEVVTRLDGATLPVAVAEIQVSAHVIALAGEEPKVCTTLSIDAISPPNCRGIPLAGLDQGLLEATSGGVAHSVLELSLSMTDRARLTAVLHEKSVMALG